MMSVWDDVVGQPEAVAVLSRAARRRGRRARRRLLAEQGARGGG